jgi:hypothetical protein
MNYVAVAIPEAGTPVLIPPSPASDQALEPPFARLYGQPVIDIPADLFIPPDALRIIRAFEGPLTYCSSDPEGTTSRPDTWMARLAQYMAQVEVTGGNI